ncbi:MAG TPA: hypothetical protein VLL47_06170 [Robiginitalea sp.]|nr:hypothetical protein [Robiginitalea sp.]
MISCEQATTICHKSQYREAGWGERFQLWLHLLHCRGCSRFSLRNRKLTDLCNQASLRQLSTREKDAMKRRLQEGKAP